MASPIQFTGKLVRYAAPVLVVVVAIVAARALIAAKAAPPKVTRPARVLPVEIATADPITSPPTYEAYGVVRPLRELSVRPVVGGPIVAVHPNLITGGRVLAGETLLQVDPRDYQLAVATATAALHGAQADLAIEEGSATVAKAEWKLLDGSFETTPAGRSLALREPYVAKRRAEVESAKARLDQAQLDLARVAIIAPFDAVVLSESVEVGAQVSPGSEVALIVDTSSFLVEVSLPAERTADLDFSGTVARVRLSDANPQHSRDGELLRLTGEVDPAGRMVRAQVGIVDPLEGTDPLRLGSYVRVDVPLNAIPNALSIPRAALQEGDIVWLAKDGRELAFQSVQVALRRDHDILITAGLTEGQQVITSPIAVPLPGTALRIVTEGATSTQPDAQPGADQ